MPGLPHGWRMRNKDGEVAGPPPEADGVYDSQDEDSEDGFAEALDVRPDSEGWEDAEDDTEVLSIKCLLCDEKFPTAQAMSEHCAKTHDFDLVSVQRQHSMFSPSYLSFPGWTHGHDLTIPRARLLHNHQICQLHQIRSEGWQGATRRERCSFMER